MKPYQAVGYLLLNTTAVTAITSTRVWHGLRPESSDTPSISYFELGGGQRYRGMENQPIALNCRADTPEGARDLARVVVNLFSGDMGIRGDINGFKVGKCSLQNDNGLNPEPDDNLYNAPVDILLIYPSKTVS